MAFSFRRTRNNRNFYRRRARITRSVKAVTTSRAFKASASNMTQNGRFNISVKTTVGIPIAQNEAVGTIKVDVPNQILTSDMHKQLSNVFDQYKIEKCVIKFSPINVLSLTPDEGDIVLPAYAAFFSCVDRSGFAAAVTVGQLRTYGSYKETTWPVNGDSITPHVVSIGQSDLVSRSEYYDTKQRAKFPEVMVGYEFASGVSHDAVTVNISVEFDVMIRYRGVRLDTTGVLAIIPTN